MSITAILDDTKQLSATLGEEKSITVSLSKYGIVGLTAQTNVRKVEVRRAI